MTGNSVSHLEVYCINNPVQRNCMLYYVRFRNENVRIAFSCQMENESDLLDLPSDF